MPLDKPALKAKDAPELGTFSWDDPLRLERQLTEDERMLRDAAQEFAQSVLQPRVIDAYRNETSAPDLFPLMGEAGLLGATLPEAYGGLGANYVTYGLIAREIERVDSGYRSMMSVQSSLVIYPIYAYGSEEQRQKYLPGLCSGALIGCFGLTEPDAGSDPAGMKTRAEKTATGYKLTGSKMWISNAPFADVFVVWAKSDAHGGRIRGFILEKRHDGAERAQDRGQAVLARFDHRRNRDGRGRSGRRCAAALCSRAERPVRLPEPRALRHCLGRDGGGGILLACRAAIWP